MTQPKMRRSTKRLLWVLAIVCGIAICQYVFGWGAIHDFLVHPAVTAWVQSLGTIAAVYVAIRLASEQRRSEMMDEGLRMAESRRAMTFTILHAVEATEKTLRYLYFEFSVSEGQRRPKRTERLEDLQQTFETLIAKDLPDDLLQHVLAVKREISYALMALRSLQKSKLITPQRIRGARTRFNRVSATSASIRTQLIAMGHVFNEPIFARTGGGNNTESTLASQAKWEQPKVSEDYSKDIPLDVEMTEDD